MRRHQQSAGIRVSGRTIKFISGAALAEIVVKQEAAGEGFRSPLFRAASAGALSLVIACGGGPVPARILKQRVPTTIILPDDHPAATGPKAWPQARKLARWASLVALHATGGQPEHYAMFAHHAVRHGRLLVVEIEQRYLAAWLGLVQQERRPGQVLCLTPRPGAQHPVVGAPPGVVVQ